METIYSKVLWNELGLREYKIHVEPWEKTNALILNWVKDAPLEKVTEVLLDLSWIASIVDDSYYDGQFYGINQRDKKHRPKLESGRIQSDITIHECGVLPSILHIAINTGTSPQELRFCADILEEYLKRLLDAGGTIKLDEED